MLLLIPAAANCPNTCWRSRLKGASENQWLPHQNPSSPGGTLKFFSWRQNRWQRAGGQQAVGQGSRETPLNPLNPQWSWPGVPQPGWKPHCSPWIWAPTQAGATPHWEKPVEAALGAFSLFRGGTRLSWWMDRWIIYMNLKPVNIQETTIVIQMSPKYSKRH